MITTTSPRQKERPILFKADMVRAILDGRKTQTRRLLRVHISGGRYWTPLYQVQPQGDGTWADSHCESFRCPYGVAGDRLWVRERLAEVIGGWIYVTDCAPVPPTGNRSPISKSGRNYCPSIFMPRWASRITLEITEVRVERVQGISEKDARAEGCHVGVGAGNWRNARHRYQDLWDSINGKVAWDENPWVWVISFCRVGNANHLADQVTPNPAFSSEVKRGGGK